MAWVKPSLHSFNIVSKGVSNDYPSFLYEAIKPF